MKKPSAPAKQATKYPESSSTRWSVDDLKLMEQLKSATGIPTNSGIQKHCLRIAATHYKIKI